MDQNRQQERNMKGYQNNPRQGQQQNYGQQHKDNNSYANHQEKEGPSQPERRQGNINDLQPGGDKQQIAQYYQQRKEFDNNYHGKKKYDRQDFYEQDRNIGKDSQFVVNEQHYHQRQQGGYQGNRYQGNRNFNNNSNENYQNKPRFNNKNSRHGENIKSEYSSTAFYKPNMILNPWEKLLLAQESMLTQIQKEPNVENKESVIERSMGNYESKQERNQYQQSIDKQFNQQYQKRDYNSNQQNNYQGEAKWIEKKQLEQESIRSQEKEKGGQYEKKQNETQ